MKSFIRLDCDRTSLLPPHHGRTVFAHETVEDFQAVDCTAEDSRELLLARLGFEGLRPTTGPVTQWSQNTC